MAFSSNTFVILFPIFALLFFLSSSRAYQNSILFIGSIAFIWSAGYQHVLFVALVLVFSLAYLFASRREGKRIFPLLWFVVGLVGALCYFKYREFISGITGIEIPEPILFATVVPLGISFFTFQLISAFYDNRNNPKAIDAKGLCLFVVYFPQFVSGPICKWRQLGPQFASAHRFSTRNLFLGFQLFFIGYFKKVAISDPIGHSIEPIFHDPSRFHWSALLLGAIGFTIQLFCDFSGYSDMGRGVARIMGFRLPVNFRAPNLAASPIEFWARWHITLTSWIRQYVFNPLSIYVARSIRIRDLQRIALLGIVLIVMALVGVWHGAAFSFIVFGLVQGAFIALWYAGFGQSETTGVRNRVLGILATQAVLILSVIIFRSESFDHAAAYFLGLTGLQDGIRISEAYLGFAVVIALTLAMQCVEYNAGTRCVANILVPARRSPILFLVLMPAFAIVFYFRGITLEGVWYHHLVTDQFIYNAF